MTISLSLTLSNIVSGQNIDDTDVTVPFTELRTHLENVLNGVQPFETVNLGATSEVTIASGAITVTGSNHRVDTEGNAATDDLDTINGGSEGRVVWLRLENAARTVRLRHNVGNIYLSSLSNYTLSNQYETIPLIYTGSRWTDWAKGQRVEGVTVITPWTSMSAGPNSITGIPNTYPVLKLLLRVSMTALATFSMRFNNSALADYANFTEGRWNGGSSSTDGFGGTEIPLPAAYLPTTQTILELTILNANGTGGRSLQWNGFSVESLTTGDLIYHLGGGYWADSGSSGAINRIDFPAINVNTNSRYMLLGTG
ncbi:MAG: hypothetical protein JNJ61_10725 [Anaerolineae bacterium]|nr:hypothetical protein [Anaerolineae bacterium]